MKNKRLQLSDLKVQSFVTMLGTDITDTIKAGSSRDTDNPNDTYCAVITGPGYHMYGNEMTISEHMP